MAEEETLEQNSASQPRELDPNPQPKIMRASHVSVTVDTLESEFSRLGFATWKCVECGIWRVPGAPFCLSGEKKQFLGTCSLNDTSRLCCNCERQLEQYYWKGKRIQLYRRGTCNETQHIKLLDPPDRMVDVETQEIVWSSTPSADGEKPMEAAKGKKGKKKK